MSLSNTAAQLNKAAKIAEKIEELNVELAEILSSLSLGQVAQVPGKRGPKKGGMSAEGRARIAEGQKKRWAKANAGKAEKVEKTEAVVEKPAKKKRKMTAEGRAAIAAAQKARWAKKNAEKKA